MLIEYRGNIVDVEVMQHDETDFGMPYLFRFPEGSPYYAEEGVWLEAHAYKIIREDFVLIEMADAELIGVHLFESEDVARTAFDRMCEENNVTAEPDAEFGRESAGTIAMADGHGYSVQLLRKRVLTDPLPPVAERTDPAI